MCPFCTSGTVESEKHCILECDNFRDSYSSILTSVPWHCLFSEGTVRRLCQLIINLNNKRIELQKTKSRKASGPIDYI